jgi:hypothetical protein
METMRVSQINGKHPSYNDLSCSMITEDYLKANKKPKRNTKVSEPEYEISRPILLFSMFITSLFLMLEREP